MSFCLQNIVAPSLGLVGQFLFPDITNMYQSVSQMRNIQSAIFNGKNPLHSDGDGITPVQRLLKKVRSLASTALNSMQVIQFLPTVANRIGIHFAIPYLQSIARVMLKWDMALSIFGMFLSGISIIRVSNFYHRFCSLSLNSAESLQEAQTRFHSQFPRSVWTNIDLSKDPHYKKLKRFVGETCATYIRKKQCNNEPLDKSDFTYIQQQAIKKLVLHCISFSISLCFFLVNVLGMTTPVGIFCFTLATTLLIAYPCITQGWVQKQGWAYSFDFLVKDLQSLDRFLFHVRLRTHQAWLRANLHLRSVQSQLQQMGDSLCH